MSNHKLSIPSRIETITQAQHGRKLAGRVMVIYTGGTIGMAEDEEEGSLSPFQFEHILDRMPEIKWMSCGLDVLIWENPVDSSNIAPRYWVELAQTIKKYYYNYDGFVILHGTDTMAFTASALSFMLENLAKPVVLTGSQLPVGSPRTDARANFVSALEVALHKTNGHATINEVCILFDSLLIRGNRAKKVETEQFAAFISENYPPLGKVGVDITYNYDKLAPHPDGIFRVEDQLEDQVFILKVFPGMNKDYVACLLGQERLRGIVLESYGMGNVPNSPEMLEVFAQATRRGVIIVNVSQCLGGQIQQGKYAAGKFLKKIGVVSGKDITTEAALTKLMFLLGQEMSLENVRNYMSRPIRYEMRH